MEKLTWVREHWLICSSVGSTIFFAVLLPALGASEVFTATILALVASIGVYLQQQLDNKGNRASLIKKLIEDTRKNTTSCEQLSNSAVDCRSKFDSYASTDKNVNVEANLQIYYNSFIDSVSRIKMRDMTLSSHERNLLDDTERLCVLDAADKVSSTVNLIETQHMRGKAENSKKSVTIYLDSIQAACNEAENALRLIISKFTVTSIRR